MIPGPTVDSLLNSDSAHAVVDLTLTNSTTCNNPNRPRGLAGGSNGEALESKETRKRGQLQAKYKKKKERKDGDAAKMRGNRGIYEAAVYEPTPLIWENVRRQVPSFGGITETVDRMPFEKLHGNHGEFNSTLLFIFISLDQADLPQIDALPEDVDPIVAQLVKEKDYKLVKNIMG